MQKLADGHENENDGNRHQRGGDHRPARGSGVAAGQQSLCRILVQAEIAEVEQKHAGENRPDRERFGKVQREVEQHEFVGSIWRFAQRGERLGRAQRQLRPDAGQGDQRRAEVDDELAKIAPDHRADAARQGQAQRTQRDHANRQDHALRLDVEKQHHRHRGRRDVDPGAAGENPADEIHRPGCPLRPVAIADGEQLVNRRHLERVETREQKPRRDQGREHPAQGGGDIAVIAAEAVVGPAKEGGRGLVRRDDRDHHQPDRHLVATEEVVAHRLVRPARKHHPAANHRRHIKRDNRPVEKGERCRHAGRPI